MTGLSVELGVYAPLSNTLIETIPFPSSFSATGVYNRVAEGSLTIAVQRDQQGADWLLQPCEIAVRANTGANDSYVELPAMRFLTAGDHREETARQGPESLYTAECVPVGWLFSKALVYPREGLKPKERGLRRYKAQTVGQIWNDILFDAQNRGDAEGIKKNWTNTADSRGKAWGATYTRTLNVGDTLLDVLNAMVDNNMCDVWFNGRLFELFKPGTLGEPKPAVLRYGQDLKKVPRDRDRTTIATNALGMGQNGKYRGTIPNTQYPESSSPWGRWSVAVSVNGDTYDEVETGATQILAREHSRHDIEYSVELTMNPDGPLPFIKYGLGDFVGIATGPSGEVSPMTRHQVERITLARTGASGSQAMLGGVLQLGKTRIRKRATREAAVQQAVAKLGKTVTTLSSTMRAVSSVAMADAAEIPTESLLFKTANESVTNTAALQDDNHLFVELDSESEYLIEGLLSTLGADPGGGATDHPGDIKVGWSTPAGASGLWSSLGPIVGALNANLPNAQGRWFTRDFTGTMSYGIGWDSGTPNDVWIRGAIRTGSTGGTLRLRWAQNTAAAAATQVNVDSWLYVKRIG